MVKIGRKARVIIGLAVLLSLLILCAECVAGIQ
jgi:hypothetical protein